jgi:hypothetical protein
MVKSNTLTITVTAPPVVIKTNTITADKTTVVVGETVTITGTLEFSAALPSDRRVRIDLYVNDAVTASWEIVASKGSTKASYTRQLQFTAEGTYRVYTDANFV